MLLVLAGILALSACKKDTPFVDPNPLVDVIRNFATVSTSVAGIVMDRNNQPIEGAAVTFGSSNTMTDENGAFKMDNVITMENAAYVRVFKEGYFDGSRKFFAFNNQRSNISIHLLEKTIQGTVDASGGNVTLPEGVKLDFPANAVKDSDGNLYNGTVQVAAQYLDPAANNIMQIMPGNLRGVTTENVEEGLTTYGMVAVELLTPSGDPLNVADGKTVQITMPVTSAQMSDAPTEIPLWYFDEDAGTWKEEGKATLQGNEYVGEVSHFTFWNCDVNWDLIYLDGKVLLEGAGLEGANVCLTIDGGTNWATACDFTNEMGAFTGQVPTNTTFTLNVYPPSFECGNAIYSQSIGPFTADVTLDDINILASTIQANYTHVTGTIVDCDNNPITNGYAKIKIGTAQYYAYTTDGSIDFTVLNCVGVTTIEIAAFDSDAAKQSETASFTFANDLDFGTLQACEQLDEFIIYEYDGVSISILENVAIYDSLGNGTGAQFLYGDGTNEYMSLSTNEGGLGTFPAVGFWTSQFGNNPTGIIGNDIMVTYTQYSTVVGGTVAGTFDGNVETQTGLIPVTGSFKAKREF